MLRHIGIIAPSLIQSESWIIYVKRGILRLLPNVRDERAMLVIQFTV
jgi:hypothetical protein